MYVRAFVDKKQRQDSIPNRCLLSPPRCAVNDVLLWPPLGAYCVVSSTHHVKARRSRTSCSHLAHERCTSCHLAGTVVECARGPAGSTVCLIGASIPKSNHINITDTQASCERDAQVCQMCVVCVHGVRMRYVCAVCGVLYVWGVRAWYVCERVFVYARVCVCVHAACACSPARLQVPWVLVQVGCNC